MLWWATMNWWVWVIIAIVAFGLGMASVLYFQKTHPPDRRKTDRRTVERRAPRQGVPSGTAERRAADRRTGADRRRGKPLWQLGTVVVSAVFLSIIGVVAYAESQVASIFVGQDPALINSGWAACDTPITWSMDTSRVASAADKKLLEQQITDDLAKWGEASGLKFQSVGEVPVNYDDTNFVVTSDVHPSDRHLYIAFLKDSESTLLDDRTVGFASPTKVWQDSKEITEGSVVLSIDYVKKINAKKQSALYLHEIGHALGLGHGTSKQNVMYYLVDTNNLLSPGDIDGIRNLIKACKTG